MTAKSYEVFSGPKLYNIIYIEGMDADGTLNADTPNYFNDQRLVIQVLDCIPKIIGNWEGTTEPGNHYTSNPMNPRGTLRIAFGQYTAWCLGITALATATKLWFR